MIRNEPSHFVHSTPTPNWLAAQLETHYGLDIESCRYLSADDADLYSVRDAGGRVFNARIDWHGLRKNHELEFELDLLDYLAMRGARVCRAIRTLDDHRTFSLPCAEGERQVLLTDSPIGHAINTADSASVMAMAESVAKFHVVAADYCAELSNNSPDSYLHGPRLGKQALLRMPLEYLRPICTPDEPALAELQNLSDQLNARLNSLGANNWPLGLCHGNLSPDNFHIDAAANVTLSDLGRCGIGWPVFDLAVILASADQACGDQFWPNFMQTYRRHNQLEETQLDALPLLIACHHLWKLGRRACMARQKGRGYATPDYLRQQAAGIRAQLQSFDQATRND